MLKVTSPSFSAHPFLKDKTLNLFPDAVLNEMGERFSNERLKEYLLDADMAIVGLEKIDDALLDTLPNLRFIAKYGVGLDNIDLEACKARKVGIGWTGGVNKLSVAELALCNMLSLLRNVSCSNVRIKNGVWKKEGGRNLTGKTIGVIGVGHIGQEVVRLLAPFQCRILVNDILPLDDFCAKTGAISTSKDTIYDEADIITLHTPLTPDTENLINMNVMHRMKNDAMVVNTARGGIVHEKDLYVALREGVIAGAALDVFSEEPALENELVGLDNLLCTPHIGGNSQESIKAMGESALDHICKYVKGM